MADEDFEAQPKKRRNVAHLRGHLIRDHKKALAAGAPSVPRGYFWTPISDGSFTLMREIPADAPDQLKTRYVGSLENDVWKSNNVHDDPFSPLEQGSSSLPESTEKEVTDVLPSKPLSFRLQNDENSRMVTDEIPETIPQTDSNVLPLRPPAVAESPGESRQSDRVQTMGRELGIPHGAVPVTGNLALDYDTVEEHARLYHFPVTGDRMTEPEVTGHQQAPAKVTGDRKGLTAVTGDQATVKPVTGYQSSSFDIKVWKKSREMPGFLIRRLEGCDIGEEKYGVKYLVRVAGGKTKVNRAISPRCGYYNWQALADAGWLAKEI